MAKMVLADPVVEINGTDLTDHFSAVAIQDGSDEMDLTGFEDSEREFSPGLKDATITGTAFHDQAAGQIDDVLWPLYQSGSVFPVMVRATSAPESPTNPRYWMLSRLFQYSPAAGGPGDADMAELVFRSGSPYGLVRWIGVTTGIDAGGDPFFDPAGVSGSTARFLGIDSGGDPALDTVVFVADARARLDSDGDVAAVPLTGG